MVLGAGSMVQRGVGFDFVCNTASLHKIYYQRLLYDWRGVRLRRAVVKLCAAFMRLILQLNGILTQEVATKEVPCWQADPNAEDIRDLSFIMKPLSRSTTYV